MGKRWAISMPLIVLFLSMMLFPIPIEAQSNQPSDLNVGPYIDELVYRVMWHHDDSVAALIHGTIDLSIETYDLSGYAWLADVEPDIGYFAAVRNGYGHITINSRDYPMNISGFRRAFAFAYDKRAFQEGIMNGFSELHDSLVPLTSPFSIEEDLEWHYYDAQPEIGNQILDDLGFEIQGDGWRTAPDGTPFDISIVYPGYQPYIAGGCAQLAADALESLHCHAHVIPQDFNTYLVNLNSGSEYDMVVRETDFCGTDVSWLAYSYWSELADGSLNNPSHFANATYDSYRDDLFEAATYEEVYEVAAEMQRILHYNVPVLVTYENVYIHLFRTDTFTGQVQDLVSQIASPWTARKIHRIDGYAGGTVTVAIGQEPDSFNFFVSNSQYAAAIDTHFWPSLYTHAPDLSPYPYLAENLIVETHEDNPSVVDGQTRFTIDIIQNATWSDGISLTAADVAFTFIFAIETARFGNPDAADLSNLMSAYTPNRYRVVLEFQGESYLHFPCFAYDYIIPQHIFAYETGFDYEDWNSWNPVFDLREPYVTSGPFILSDFEPGEFYNLTANPNFAFYPQDLQWPDPNATNPGTNTPGLPVNEPLSPITVASTVVSGVSSMVILVMIVKIVQHRRGEYE